MTTIALVEDDLPTATLMQRYLSEEGYCVERFVDGREAIKTLRKSRFDLLIVDWELPVIRGNEVVDWARKNLGDVLPIMFVTHRSAEQDIVEALRNGADEFLIKPVRKDEFLARVRALLRRSIGVSGSSRFTVGRYSIDLQRSEIQLAGIPIALSPREFSLACYLFQHKGRLVTSQELIGAVWGRELDPFSRTFDTHIAKIRKKLSIGPANRVMLTRVYSLGCRLEEIETDGETSASSVPNVEMSGDAH